MRVSAIRVGADLWNLLEDEAARVGVSVSQYVREAALARASAAVNARGEDPFELLALSAPEASRASAADARQRRGRRARQRAGVMKAEARALRAQSRQAQRHSRQLAPEQGDPRASNDSAPSD